MPASTLPSPVTGHADLVAGIKQGLLLGAAAVALTLPPPGLASLHGRRATEAAEAAQAVAAPATLSSPSAVSKSSIPPRPVAAHRLADFAEVAPTDDVKYVADWVADSRDNAGSAFAILDKRDARVYVFDPNARLVAASPVLLGAAAGDDSVAGIGQRPIKEVRPEERTTPAGRFVSTPGRNASGEDVVWVDYDAAVSMHRVRPVDPKERRLERLASPDPRERRISYGCINVPAAFFNAVVHPVLGAGRNVVYVLPERRSVRETFAASYPVAERHAQAGMTGTTRALQ